MLTLNEKPNATKGVGELLVANKVISQSQLNLCINAQSRLADFGITNSVGEVAFELGLATKVQLKHAAKEAGDGDISFSKINIPISILRAIGAVPHGVDDDVLVVSSIEPLTPQNKNDLIRAADGLGVKVTDVKRTPKDRALVLDELSGGATVDGSSLALEIAEFCRNTDNGQLLNQVIDHVFIDAIQSSASDIHIKVSANPILNWVSYRVDGLRRPKYLLTHAAIQAFSTRIKSIAGIDFSNTRIPHDGRLSIEYRGNRVDFRINALPLDGGETLTLRILDTSRALSLQTLMTGQDYIYKRLIEIASMKKKTGGIVLVTGATGSGKSTTLNALIREIDRCALRVITVEDPVEIQIPMVEHVQTNEDAGLTFPVALRAIMRSDPDVIMVGEMRDAVTAKLGVSASETGHMMLTTLHTSDVPQSISRLVSMLPDEYKSMGAFAIAHLLKGVIHQRLTRKLCSCSKTVNAHKHWPPGAAALNLPEDAEVNVAVGCEHCDHTGYRDRVLVLEGAFFSQDKKLRTQMEEVFLSNSVLGRVVELDGVDYWSVRDSVESLLSLKLIDMREACSALDIKV